MQFSQLIHQPPGLAQLRQMAAQDRLPHANLLLSPPGAGGLPAALAVAQLLLCENRQGDTPCGKCRACRKTAGFVHPDLHFAFPTVGSKMTSDPFLPQWREALKEAPYLEVNDWLQRIGAENKQGNITRDACANILRKLTLKTFEGRYKIMLIWLPEYLGDEGNRLLKMIEEPPEKTVFFLVAERAELILNTILSRCQLTKLGPPTSEEMTAGLHRMGIEPERALAAARLADGNFNLARALAENEAASHGPRFLEWIRACYQGSAAKLTTWTEDFAKLGRENQKHFLRYALHFWREFLLLSVTDNANGNVRLPAAELESARKLLPLIDHDQLAEISTIISECTEHVERNANPKILFLDAGIRIHRTLRYPRPAPAAAPVASSINT
ncbi:MAG: hypothetical protein AAFZ52_07360 [Bacteroidota bacterium]